jgi:predicted translin family RNA/ssDNA-binding protein
VQTINRFRYARSLVCLEELVEALTFCHYLTTQTLISPAQLQPIVEALARQGATAKEDEVMTTDADATPAPGQSAETSVPTIGLTDDDYIYGIFDLTGEMMRFATTTSALTGKMASSDVGGGDRDIVHDMHELGTLFEILPRRSGNRNMWEKKLEVTRQSVQKVEKLGYDLKVRGSERPKGWVPDLSAAGQEDSHE